MTAHRISTDTDITVSAIVQRDEGFLCIEETSSSGPVVNIPGGHIEHGETPEEAVVREVLEETRWHFQPTGFVGAYLWHDSDRERHYLRLIYCGSVAEEALERTLDDGILSVHWRSRDTLAADSARLRAPVVLHSIDDFLMGQRARFAAAQATDRASIIQHALPVIHTL